MRILIQYLKPYKWLVALVLFLAAVNIGFSLVDPIIFGKLINLATRHQNLTSFNWDEFLFINQSYPEEVVRIKAGGVVERTIESKHYYGVMWLLIASISVAMISRIAKAFQDYFLNLITQKFGATVFTQGLQHAMKLPYKEFEDARSGETLSVLQKVRIDTEKFVSSFINVLFPVIVGIIFVAVYATSIHWSLPLVYFGGIFLLTFISNLLSKKVKIIQKKIVGQTTALAGATTESLRNIELVKSLGLTEQEVGRLNKNTFKILGLELTKVKRIRSISFVQGTFVNTLRQVILFLLMLFIYQEKWMQVKL